MRVHLVFIHVVCGVSVEVAGTKHVATASFDVAGGHIKIGFGSFLLRGRGEVDEAGGKRKERKQKQTRHKSHLTLLRNCDLKGPRGIGRVYTRAVVDSRGPIRDLAVKMGRLRKKKVSAPPFGTQITTADRTPLHTPHPPHT